MAQSRKIVRAAVLGTLLAVGTLVPTTSAQATPTNCSGRYDLNSYSAFCGSGSGEYRARVRCYRNSGAYTTRYGAWRYTGGALSTASCRSTEEAASGGWDFR